MKTSLVAIAALLVLSGAAFAAKPVTEKETVTVKVTIDAIDHANRLISFKDKDGNYETVVAGPEVQRFDELKVGDKVTFHYTESVVIELRKPGEPAPASAAGDATIVRNATDKPSGTLTQQETATVTVKSIDMAIPSVTITTEDGITMSYKVKDKGRLKGVNPGDRIVITYTDALLITVK